MTSTGRAPRRLTGAGILLMIAMLASGCMSAGSTPAGGSGEPAGQAGQDPLPSTVPLPLVVASDFETVLPACIESCFEPSVAIDGEGRILAISNNGMTAAMSEDGGRTFKSVPSVPIPDGGPVGGPGNHGVDGVLSTGLDGRIYYTNMWVGLESNAGSVLQVASTADGGFTWEPNVLIGPIEAHTSVLTLADRPWVYADADGTVYLSYFQSTVMARYMPVVYQLPGAPVAVSQNWIARSGDGGRTFGPFYPISPLTSRPDRMWAPVTGQMGLDSEGRVFVPFWAVGEDGGTTQYVASSSDHGESFQTVAVAEDAGFAFSSLAVDVNDVVWVTWSDMDGRLWVSWSLDHGASWSERVQLNAGGQNGASPWIAADGDGVNVVWYDAADRDHFDLRLARLALERDELLRSFHTIQFGINGVANRHFPGTAPSTDFAHFTIGPAGEVLAIWDDAERPPHLRLRSVVLEDAPDKRPDADARDGP